MKSIVRNSLIAIFLAGIIVIAVSRNYYSNIGLASRYSNYLAGRKTASGERYDPQKLTAAHRELPLGTKVKVISLENGKAVTVTINDRGPYVRGRIIDLSLAAARQLDMVKQGLAKVKIEVVAK